MNRSEIFSTWMVELPGYGSFVGTRISFIEVEDDDENCRLRNGLNVECLTKIFPVFRNQRLIQSWINEQILSAYHIRICNR